MSIVGAGQYLMTGGWSFWPVGDFYRLEPKWEEWHSVTGNVVHSEDEPNRYELVASFDGPDPFIVLAITNDDPNTLVIEDETVIPVGTPVFSSRAWKSDGFNEERELGVDLVVNELDEWIGEFKITFPAALRQWAGPGKVLNFSFDFWTEEEPYVRTRLAHGKVVFRR
jgi:hypothetical protein